MTRGAEAEREVHDRLRRALPVDYRLYPDVRWTAPMRHGGPARDGQADLVMVHPEHGLLVLEVKSGEPSRDASGRWRLGSLVLDRSPFEQAADSKHALLAKLEDYRELAEYVGTDLVDVEEQRVRADVLDDPDSLVRAVTKHLMPRSAEPTGPAGELE